MSELNMNRRSGEREPSGCLNCERMRNGEPCLENCEHAEVTSKELAVIVGLSYSWLMKLAQRGVIKPTNTAYHRTYRYEAVKEMLLTHYGGWAVQMLAGSQQRLRQALTQRQKRRTRMGIGSRKLRKGRKR